MRQRIACRRDHKLYHHDVKLYPAITSAIGTGATLTLIERFTRVDDDTLLYEYTVDDPAVFTRSFTMAIPMQRSELPMFEYACHEGNRGLTNILAGARSTESD